MDANTSASIVSSSMSIKSIFSRIHCMAASVHNAAISAPTKPWVSLAISSGSTSSESYRIEKKKEKINYTKKRKRNTKKKEIKKLVNKMHNKNNQTKRFLSFF